MKNKNGFTLIELLAVIVILGAIMTIAIPAMLERIKNAKSDAYNAQVITIESAADKYMMANDDYDSLALGETITLTLQNLYDSGDLSTLKNPSTGENLDPTSLIYVTKTSSGSFDYEYANDTDCRYNGHECLVDNILKDLVGKSQTYQGGTYYKGTNATILNNFVWYSGQEYRVMGINSDGTLKLVTSLPVVAISWGPVGTADYTNSYARKWLNILPVGNTLKDDYEGVFYKNLNRPDLVKDYAFCIGKQNPTSGTDTTCNTKVTDKVGLLTWWEYKIAGSNANGDGSYLDLNDYIAFLTGDSRTATNVLTTNEEGSLYEVEGTTFASYATNDYRASGGFRPVINLTATVSIKSGIGTVSDPYKLVGDETAGNNDSLASRNAGEYLTMNGKKYRIVSIDANGITKIVTDNYVTTTGTTNGITYTYFDKGLNGSNSCLEASPYTNCSNIFNINDGSGDYDGSQGDNIGYYLNSSASNSFYTSLTPTYQNYLESGTYYFGKWNLGLDYNKTYTDVISNGYGTQSLKVGLLQYGEMLAGNNVNSSTSSPSYWLISPYNNAVISSYTTGYGFSYVSYPSDPWYATRPVLNLKSSIIITGGQGTKDSPYTISM